jgi:hypothetical protein
MLAARQRAVRGGWTAASPSDVISVCRGRLGRQPRAAVRDGIFTHRSARNRLREDWAHVFFELSRILVWLVTLLYAGALAASVIHGRVVFGTWKQEWGGYDWRSMQDLKTIALLWILAPPVSGTAAGLVSFALRPSRRVAVLVFLGFGECLGFLLALRWLLS